MRLDSIAKISTLQKFIISEPDIVLDYGDELEFYSYPEESKQHLKFINDNNLDYQNTIEILKLMILDKNGMPVITDGYKMPNRVMLCAYNRLKNELME